MKSQTSMNGLMYVQNTKHGEAERKRLMRGVVIKIQLKEKEILKLHSHFGCDPSNPAIKSATAPYRRSRPDGWDRGIVATPIAASCDRGQGHQGQSYRLQLF